MDKTEKLIIVGKSGSGKNFLLEKLAEKGLKPSIKWTTRPQRKNEKNGLEYTFTDNKHFERMIEGDQFIAWQTFKNDAGNIWYYGVSKHDFEENQAFIMTPGEISNLNEYQRKSAFVVYLDIDRSVRESRLPIREDNNDSIKRRLDADEIDFEKFRDYDLKLTDPEFDVDVVWTLMN